MTTISGAQGSDESTNTVPGLVQKLSGSEPFTLSEKDYDHLYVVTRTADGGPATLLKLRFGER